MWMAIFGVITGGNIMILINGHEPTSWLEITLMILCAVGFLIETTAKLLRGN